MGGQTCSEVIGMTFPWDEEGKGSEKHVCIYIVRTVLGPVESSDNIDKERYAYKGVIQTNDPTP